MDYGTLIDKIMPLVDSGDSALPFIISRNDGQWEIDYLNIAPDKEPDYLAYVREYDPCAMRFTGADFAGGGFPYVYDKVLTERLRAEYNEAHGDGAGGGEHRALVSFMEDNIGGFSPEVTGHLTELDKPLAALFRMGLPRLFSLVDDYDADNAQEAIEIIENRVAELRSRKNEEITGDMVKKRNIEGYVELASIPIAGCVIVLAEKPGDAEPYLVCNLKYDNPLGIEEWYDGAVTDDYVEAVREFTGRAQALAQSLQAERERRGLSFAPLTAADCIANVLDSDLTGKKLAAMEAPAQAQTPVSKEPSPRPERSHKKPNLHEKLEKAKKTAQDTAKKNENLGAKPKNRDDKEV